MKKGRIGDIAVKSQKDKFKATPHKDRLRALRHIYLQIFRHITQIYLEIR